MTAAADLSPSASLLAEVIAARWRLGHPVWYVERRYRRQLRELERRNYVGWKSSSDTLDMAWLTDHGRASLLSDTYTPPNPPVGAVAGAVTGFRSDGSHRFVEFAIDGSVDLGSVALSDTWTLTPPQRSR